MAYKNHSCRFGGLLVLLLVSNIGLGRAAENGPSITVQFVARGLEPKPSQLVSGDHHDPSPSHVFMIVKIATAQGIKEEAYGFYPAEGDHGIIKGPGMLKSEFRCGRNDDCDPSHNNELKRLSESEASVTVPVTFEERQKVLRDVVKWDNKDFQLNTQNCIDFVDSVAKDLGYPTPTRSSMQLPIDYLKQLKPLVEQEQTRRAQAAQAELERQRQAEAEQERQRQEQERQRQAEAERERQREVEAEARRIPPGWVPCSCPAVHAHLGTGKYVDGILYHPNNVRCPQ